MKTDRRQGSLYRAERCAVFAFRKVMSGMAANAASTYNYICPREMPARAMPTSSFGA